MLTRRAFLSSAVAAGAGVAVAACTRSSSPSGSPAAPAPTGRGVVAGATRQQLLPADRYGLVNFPDGHITYQPVQGGYRVWIASGVEGSGGSTVALDSPDLVTFRPSALSGGTAVAGLSPVGGQTALDSDYCGPGSVVPAADGSGLWLIYHGENHTFAGVTNVGSPFYATVGLAWSDDGGVTWQRRGAAITGQVPRDDQPAPRDVVGAGSPSAVVVGDLVYVVYLDWNLSGPDELHLARAPLTSLDDPAAWEKWHDGAFSSPGAGGPSTAVVTRPGNGQETVFAGGASLSWNTELQRHLLVFQSADGFWWTSSQDLVQWADPVRFLADDAPALDGARFIAYGSLLSPGQQSDQVTGRDAFLYLATTGEDEDSHSMWRIPVTVSAA